MIRPNFKDEQMAFEYAIYMIVGSYFKKATAKNKIQETDRRVMYGEERNDEQYRMEKACMDFVKEKLSKVPSAFWQEEMKVSFTPVDGFKAKIIRFEGEKYVLYVAGFSQRRQLTFHDPIICKKGK